MFTVTAAATNRNLTNAAAVKADLNISGSSEDTYLTRQIQIATAKICSYLETAAANDGSVTLGRETVRETLRPGCPSPFSLKLARWPVSAVSSVTVDGTALTTDDYELDGASGILYRLSGDSKTLWNATEIVIVYTAGWLLPDDGGTRNLPLDIEGACIDLVKAARFSRDRDPLLKSEETAGIGRNDYWVGGTPGGASIPADIAAVLDRYKG